MLHTVTGSEEILSKHYAAGGQETFIYPLSKHVIYTWYKRWRENSTQVNKSEIVNPREMQYYYRIRDWETWLSCVFLKEEKEGISFFLQALFISGLMEKQHDSKYDRSKYK